MIPVTTILLTPRCRLRYPDETDLPHIWTASRVDGFTEGMQWEPPRSTDELHAPLERARAAWAAGTAYSFTIEARATGAFIGRSSIRQESAPGVWSLGFWTHPEKQGRGYAREAAAAVVAFGFGRLEASVITAAHATWNAASERVLAHLGMTCVGVNPRGFQKRGSWVELREYELRRDQA